MPIILPFLYKKRVGPKEKKPPSKRSRIFWIIVVIIFNIFLAASAILIADRIGKPTPIPPGKVPACDRVDISGHVFNDINRNERWDEGEQPLERWEVRLEEPTHTSITNDQGHYTFKELLPGLYTVISVAQEGWEATLVPEMPIYLEEGAKIYDVDFGYVYPVTDLSIIKAADKGQLSINEQITYTITYKNEGQGLAEVVVVTDTIPEHTTFVSASDRGKETSPGIISWAIGNMLPGDEGTVEFTIETNADLTAANSLTNTVTIQTSTHEDNLGNNSYITVTPVITAQTHRECAAEKCTVVEGEGVDECVTDEDCATEAPPTHKTCLDEHCLEVSGEGLDTCQTDSDCVYEAPRVHKICSNDSCVEIPGEGNNECISDSDCISSVETTHKECQNSVCLAVSGAGADECSSNSDCIPTEVPETAWQKPALATFLISFLLILIGTAI